MPQTRTQMHISAPDNLFGQTLQHKDVSTTTTAMKAFVKCAI